MLQKEKLYNQHFYSLSDITSATERQINETMSLKLERLTYAIAEQEGWHTPIDDPTIQGSKSYRYHNPGNLRKSPFQIGIENGFAVFRSDEDGFAALRWDIRQKALGNTTTGLTANSTLADLINIYAKEKPTDNVDFYIMAVSAMTGIDKNARLGDIIK